jgi:2-O-methyltransferase
MKKLLVGFLALSAHFVFAAYNDYHFEGIDPAWENMERIDIIKQFLPEDTMVFEAGAFDGNEAIAFAKLWPKGTIISFEANPTRFAAYQEKIAQYPNVRSFNLAVNTYNGVAPFYLCWGTGGTNPDFEGASSLLPASEGMKIHYMGPVINVPCVVLDDWCSDHDITHLDFMWLDLEGIELPLLQSSPNIFKTVKLIYTETNFQFFRQGMTQFADLHSFLTSRGFTIIAHWYREGLQGDAIYIRKELLQAHH